jgi:hypothetical protein
VVIVAPEVGPRLLGVPSHPLIIAVEIVVAAIPVLVFAATVAPLAGQMAIIFEWRKPSLAARAMPVTVLVTMLVTTLTAGAGSAMVRAMADRLNETRLRR